MHNRPHSQETKDIIRKKLLGNIPWNKNLKMNKPAHNRLPTKIVYCKCCGIGFEIRTTSKQIYYKGHYQKIMKSGGNPTLREDIKEKIRNTLIKKYKTNPEILESRKPSGINQYSGNYSSIEKVIAKNLTKLDISFSHNLKIGRYFADFVIFNNVIIECDGLYWHRDEQKDLIRDSYLMDRGYFIFRLSEKRIKENSSGCVEDILTILQNLLSIETYGFILQELPATFKKD